MGDTVRRRYEALAEAGDLEADSAQRALADELDRLIVALGERGRQSKKSALGWLLSRGVREAPPRGLYIFGNVGRGKTFLMDLFFAAAVGRRKRRVHFHEFMDEVHERLDIIRRSLNETETVGGNAIASLAGEIAAKADLLCFDEFAVFDIADAMILGRLFEQLFADGVTVVATSNIAPDDLYKDGLNRALFLPFIALLKDHLTIFHLVALRDYRLDDAAAESRYLTPLGPRASAALSRHFARLAGSAPCSERELVNKGRRIRVSEAADGVARFAFGELCGGPLGAGDYLKIAAAFDTIIVSDVPVLGPGMRNEAKRFINMIDIFYDSGIRLIVSAAAEPDQLWQGDDAAETLEFKRTASRLVELRSDAWWENGAREKAEMKTARAK